VLCMNDERTHLLYTDHILPFSRSSDNYRSWQASYAMIS
jgi:hypothetical protein